MDLILPDVDVLVYAFMQSAPEHAHYARWLEGARQGAELALPDAVLLGMTRVSTNNRIFPRASRTPEAFGFVAALRASPGSRRIEPTEATWEQFGRLATEDVGVRGNRVPDAWLAALAISHGARLATADRDFARYDGLDWFNPVPG